MKSMKIAHMKLYLTLLSSTSMVKPAPAVYKEPLQKQETADEAYKRKSLLFTNALMSLTP